MRRLLFFILVLVIAFVHFETLANYFFNNIFLTRDLHRAEQALSGSAIFFGPEKSGGGNLPGSLFYYFIALPYHFFGYLGVWHFVVFLNALAAAMVWAFSAHFWGPTAALISFVLFLFAPAVASNVRFVTNASAVTPFLVAGIFLLLGTGSQDRRKSRLCLFLFPFFISTSFHFHMIGLAILAAAVGLWISYGCKFSKENAALAAAGFLLPLMPWMVWKIFLHFGISWGQPPNLSAGDSFEVVKFFKNIIELRVKLTNPFIQTAFLIVSPLAVGVFALGVGVNKFFPVNPANSTEMTFADRALKLILAFSSIPLIYVSATSHTNRYGAISAIVINIFLVYLNRRNFQARPGVWLGILTVALMAQNIFWIMYDPAVLAKPPVLSHWPLIIAAFLMVFLVVRSVNTARVLLGSVTFAGVYFFGAYYLGPHSVFPSERVFIKEYQARWLGETIYRSTGWNYEKFRDRYFSYGMFPDQDFSEEYRAAVRSVGPLEQRDLGGIFIVHNTLIPPNSNADQIKSFLLTNANLEKSLLSALAANQVSLEPIGQREGLFIFAYNVTNPHSFAVHFQNRGTAYQDLQGFEDSLTEKTGVIRRDGNILFYWKMCEIPGEVCWIGFSVDLDRQKKSAVVKIVGDILSQPALWTIPEYTLSLHQPYFEYKCGANGLRIPLADLVGSAVRMPGFANYLLAPFERTLQLQCPANIDRVAVGWQGASVANFEKVAIEPGLRQSVDLE